MLLKSRSRTHHPYTTTPTLGVGAKTCLPFRSIQKYSTPTLGVNTKNMLVRFPLKINAPSSLNYLSKFYYRKEAWGYTKVINKKEKRKKELLRKN